MKKSVIENIEIVTSAQIDADDFTMGEVFEMEKQSSQDGCIQNRQVNKEQIRESVEKLSENISHAEAVFGIHKPAKKLVVKIVDKNTKEIILELPPEETLDMIGKAWKLANLMER